MRYSIATAVALAGTVAVLLSAPLVAQQAPVASAPVVEIRSYNLKPGARERFHQLFEKEALPLLRKWRVDVVAYGASPHDQTSYYLMRAYANLDALQKSEDAFYGSDEWRNGPREAILACIENYATIVIPANEHTVAGLRPR
jgi:hypothetical protein